MAVPKIAVIALVAICPPNEYPIILLDIDLFLPPVIKFPTLVAPATHSVLFIIPSPPFLKITFNIISQLCRAVNHYF